MKRFVAACMTACLLMMMVPVIHHAKADQQFSDVKEEYFAFKEISYLTDKNIIKGFPDGTFKPSQTVTKRQAAVILARSLELDLTNVEDQGFEDVSKRTSGYAEISALTELGVIEKEDNFEPGSPLLRSEMAKWLKKAFDFEGAFLGHIFDVKDQELLPYVEALAAIGITVIPSDTGSFRPEMAVTRAQLVIFMTRVLEPSYRVSVPSAKYLMPELEFLMSKEEVKNKMTGYTLVGDRADGENSWMLTYSDYTLQMDNQNYTLNLLFKDNKLVSIFLNNNSSSDYEYLSADYKKAIDNQAKLLSEEIPFPMEKLDFEQAYFYTWRQNSVGYMLNSPGDISIYYTK
ncbi:S-layer homology domain-containing protein [Cytobacillus oceanisediminis]|uniref:S-layer homology domain-containing protein n=1 Tax=Cytobacillus oceanisediminis TaxID=665099 RepID=UPI003736C65C